MTGNKTSVVLRNVEKIVRRQESHISGNLAWLQTAMHPFFFSFNADETEALAVLVSALNRIHRLSYLRLTDQPERFLVAQRAGPGSLYNTLIAIKNRGNLSYAEVNTSLAPLPDDDGYLEVLRFDYTQKPDAEIAGLIKVHANDALPQGIEQEVGAEFTGQLADFDHSELHKLLKMLWINNPHYVNVSHPERLARVMYLYQQTLRHGGIHLDIQPIESAGNGETARIIFGVSNPPQRDFLLQVLEVFKRLGIAVRRSYIVTISNGVFPNFLATFYVHPLQEQALERGSALFAQLQHELYNTQILSSSSSSFVNLVVAGVMNGPDASLVKAFITFAHTSLAHSNPERFEPTGIQRAFHNNPDVSIRLVQLFYARFQPGMADREQTYNHLLAEARDMVANFNTGRRLLDETRRIIFGCTISFISHCLKTNFFVNEKHALAFRLDPAYLDELAAEFTSDLPTERPFRITFFAGRSGSGYHIGFSDIARGGWRTLMTQGHDDYINTANTLFRENYVLAHTQHLKNKDIYEGGSKLVAILSTRPDTPPPTVLQYLYKLQFGFIHAFLDLFVTAADGKAKDPNVVDYYGEEEPIELGPDENMHDVMIELIAQQAVQRGYVLGAGVMSSKKVGINHKEYGVTSIGVIRFAEVTLKETLGIDMHKDAFSVKFTGGPNGDVAGNSMRLLLARCPQVQIKLIIDGSGAIFDPQGLDHQALSAIVLQNDLDAFDPQALHPGGYLLYRNQQHTDGIRKLHKQLIQTKDGLEERWISKDEFHHTYNRLLFTVDADLFIPAGGRPETIGVHNAGQFFDSAGEPTARVIVEGANSFITPEARTYLQNHGVVIMRDASANKCGVISSSYEIIANLMLSEAEFLAHKQRYVSDVIGILNRMAEQEANLIIRRHRAAQGSLTYTEISSQLSREINSHYAKMFAYFQSTPALAQDARYEKAILSHMPALLGEKAEFRARVAHLPAKIKSALLASKLASGLVYFSDDNSVYRDIIEAQLARVV